MTTIVGRLPFDARTSNAREKDMRMVAASPLLLRGIQQQHQLLLQEQQEACELLKLVALERAPEMAKP